MTVPAAASALVLLIAFAGVPVSKQTAHPGVRNAHAMAYDDRRGATIMFGGASAVEVRGDTWAWDGTRWQSLDVKGPEPRTFPGFAWDAARGEAVLFGGKRVLFGRETDRDTLLGDTWVLRGDGWRQRMVPGPPPRSEAGIAYDSARRVVVLFGGYNQANGQTVRLGDTWEWDGAGWQQRADTGPEPRSGVAMAYDEGLRRVVLFGGNGGPRADTWTWDGERWEPVQTPATPGRFNSLAQYDTRRHELVRTTGWDGRARVRETWRFDGSRWLQTSSAGPGARNHSALAFDRRRGRLVLYGGHDGSHVFGDTWEWDGSRWHERQAAAPQPRADNGH